MLTPNSIPVGDKPADKAEALKGQVRSYLRAFQRLLRARPTDLQRRAMENAAIACSRYDRALRNYDLSGTSLAHYERVQRMSLAQMHASFGQHQPQPIMTLEQYISTRQRSADDA